MPLSKDYLNYGMMPMPDNSLMDMAITKKASEAAKATRGSYDPTGKTPEQVMAETGRQSELDQIRSQPTPPQAPELPQNKPFEQMMAETGRQSELDAMSKIPEQSAPIQPTPIAPVQPEQKPVETVLAETGQQKVLDQATNNATQSPVIEQPIMPGQPVQVTKGPPQEEVEAPREEPTEVLPHTGQGIIGGDFKISQNFNNNNPSLYSKNNGNGGRHRGTDYAIPTGTQLSAPPEGNWVVDKAGWDNSGWGNTVKVVNQDTGESLRFSHLSKINVKPGQEVSGKLIGLSGNSGKSTGAHLDLEYMNGKGQLGDVTKTNWNSYIQGQAEAPVVQENKPAMNTQQPVQNVVAQATPSATVQTQPANQITSQPQISLNPDQEKVSVNIPSLQFNPLNNLINYAN